MVHSKVVPNYIIKYLQFIVKFLISILSLIFHYLQKPHNIIWKLTKHLVNYKECKNIYKFIHYRLTIVLRYWKVYPIAPRNYWPSFEVKGCRIRRPIKPHLRIKPSYDFGVFHLHEKETQNQKYINIFFFQNT